MTQEVAEVVQGPVMWVLSVLTVSIVIVQAVLIYRLTRRFAKKEGIITDAEIRTSMKAGAITAIGPSFAVFILGLSMVKLMGAAITLMRVGIIGSVDTEMIAASLGSAVAGVTLGANDLTMRALAAALFSMAIMSLGHLLIPPLIARGLGKPIQRIIAPEDGKVGKVTIIFGAVFPLVYFVILAATQISQGLDRVFVMALSAAVMVALNRVGKEKNIKWLKEWAMGIAVLAGIICGPLFGLIF